jgi:flagellar hook-basal body complex protein FliE
MSFSIGSNLSIPSLPTGPTAANKATGPEGADSFGSVMRKAVDSVEQSQKSAEEEIARAVAGESPDLHQTIIALQTADLHFQLGLQVRNKIIGAYEEIMRMQV